MNTNLHEVSYPNLFVFISLVFVFFSVFALSAQAAEFKVVTETRTIKPGSSFEAQIVIDTQGEGINAFEGTVTSQNGLLMPLEVREGGSIVNFWIERPSIASSSVRFSGITPGGFIGEGILFSIVFRAAGPGSGTITVAHAQALRNDGAGTPARATITSARVSVSGAATATDVPPVVDTEPPELFIPAVARDPALFDGKYFLVFAAQDKISGIDHYEVCEGRRAQCVFAESPYLLQYQELDREISVRAVDKAGNERVATLRALMHAPWYQDLGLLAILGVLIFALVILRKFLWQNSTH